MSRLSQNMYIRHISSESEENAVECEPDMSCYNILAASTLRFYDTFKQLVRNDPGARYDNTSQHPFEYKIEEAFNNANVTPEEQRSWIDEIKTDFHMKNLLGLPINEHEINYRKVFVDCRSFLEVVNQIALSNVQQASIQYQTGESVKSLVQENRRLANEVVGLRAQLARMTDDVSDMKIVILRMQAEMRQYFSGNAQVTPCPNQSTLSPGQSDIQPPSMSSTHQTPLVFTSLYINLKKITNPIDLFMFWFEYRVAESYANHVARLRESDCTVESAMKNKVATVKKIVKNMCLLAEAEFPCDKPSDLNELRVWQQSLTDIARIAIEKASTQLGKRKIGMTDLKNDKRKGSKRLTINE